MALQLKPDVRPDAAPELRPDYRDSQAYFKDSRSPERLRVHYNLERRLADRLRNASAGDRARLYTEVYSELFTALPDHPQTLMGSERRNQRNDYLLSRLASFFRDDTHFLEIGCGDARLSMTVAERGTEAYALDVTDALIDRTKAPNRLQILISTGSKIPLPDNSIDIALSDQLMEHLHPDDVQDQLAEIYRVLKPGGIYHCITPNRVVGPHDVSVFFDYEATGFHLKEYDSSSLSRLFRRVGFRQLRFFMPLHAHRLPVPCMMLRAFEKILLSIPTSIRSWASRRVLLVTLMGLHVIATK